MPARTMPQKAKRRNSKSKASKTGLSPMLTASMLSVATQNLINMVAVFAVWGTVLLGLLAAGHFWNGRTM